MEELQRQRVFESQAAAQTHLVLLAHTGIVRQISQRITRRLEQHEYQHGNQHEQRNRLENTANQIAAHKHFLW
jgi:hypothetical protein